MNNSQSIFLTPINIVKGSKDILIDFLNDMCKSGFFLDDYEEVSRHFAFRDEMLSKEDPSKTIEFGRVNSLSEVLRFCYFFKKSRLIKQKIFTVWTNFSFRKMQLKKNSYSLSSYSNYAQYDDPYNSIHDTKLRIILKTFYATTK